jgi:energy-coupling factor transport system permease protein
MRMINTLKFVSIFAYTILVFFFSGWSLAAFAVLNIIAMIITRVSPASALKYLAALLPFIGFACLFNLALGYVEDAVNLALRLVLIGNITQCYKKTVSAADLSGAIEALFSPLRVFKIEGRDIGLMVCIGLAFLPVLRRDFASIRLALRAKGMRLNSRSLKYLLLPFFTGIFRRTGEISRALRAKGYE